MSILPDYFWFFLNVWKVLGLTLHLCIQNSTLLFADICCIRVILQEKDWRPASTTEKDVIIHTQRAFPRWAWQERGVCVCLLYAFIITLLVILHFTLKCSGLLSWKMWTILVRNVYWSAYGCSIRVSQNSKPVRKGLISFVIFTSPQLYKC